MSPHGQWQIRDNNSPVPKKLVQMLGAIADCTDKSRDNNFPEQTALACSVDTTACCLEGIGGHQGPPQSRMFLDSPFLLHSPTVILLMLEQSKSICCRCLRKVCCYLDVLRSLGCEHACYEFTVHKFEIDAVCLWTLDCCSLFLRVRNFCITSGDITSSEGVMAI